MEALAPEREIPDAAILTVYLHAVIDIETRGFERLPDRKPQADVLADLDEEEPLWFGITGMFGKLRLSCFDDEIYAHFSSRMSFGDEASEYRITPMGTMHTRAW